MARYRKIDLRIWNDEKFYSLSNDAKLLWFYLLTCPQTTMLGAIAIKKETICADLKWDLIRYAIPYNELYDKAMLCADDRGLFWLKNFLKYNSPENPKVVIAWKKSLELLPECPLLNVIKKSCVDHCESMGQKYLDVLADEFKNYDLEVVNQGTLNGMLYGMPYRMPYQITDNRKQITDNSYKEKKLKKENVTTPKAEKPTEVSQKLFDEWIAYKKKIDKVTIVTQRQLDFLIREAGKANISITEAMNFHMDRHWKNFTASYYVNSTQKTLSKQNTNGRYEKPMSEKDYDFSKLYED